METALPNKAERTREAIRKNAMRLFQKKGFEAVTMRDLAAACDLSLGAFYYHYKSKDEVVHEVFIASLDGHVARTKKYLATAPKKLEKVMEWICRDRFAEFADDRSMIKVLSQRLDPSDPISPWSSESREIREKSYALFEDVVEHCLPGLDSKMRRHFARSLWLHHLVLLGYWAFDKSNDSRKTEENMKRAVGLWKALPFALKVPGAKSVFNALLAPFVQLIDSEGA